MPFMSAEDKFGGWPMIKTDNEIGIGYDGIGFEAENTVEFGATTLFNPFVDIDVSNNTKNNLYISQKNRRSSSQIQINTKGWYTM